MSGLALLPSSGLLTIEELRVEIRASDRFPTPTLSNPSTFFRIGLRRTSTVLYSLSAWLFLPSYYYGSLCAISLVETYCLVLSSSPPTALFSILQAYQLFCDLASL